ncbi:MAG: hypothetical protein ACLFR2_06720 [Candidatus Kapaibacterium sp.]
MNDSYLSKVGERLFKAIKVKNLPDNAKWVFVGELQAASMSNIISLEEERKYWELLGLTREEVFKVTDFVQYAEYLGDDE